MTEHRMTAYCPFITVIMPVRNEEKFIEHSLGAVLIQDYPPHQIEILVVDGMSTDQTRECVAQMMVKYPNRHIELLDNPEKIVPTGFNRALKKAKGELIIRIDGHCEIAPDYMRRCVAALIQTGADCVGGPLRTVGKTTVAQAIAQAQSSRFGVGGAAFRMGQAQGAYVDTVAFGAYHREVFERIGGLDEELVRNQDDEFNFRLTQSGSKIWLDPAIQAIYYSRASLTKLWHQYYQYGLYKVRVIQKRGAVPSWRHLVPALFVVGLFASVLVTLWTRQWFWLLPVGGTYLLLNLLVSIWMARHHWRTLPFLPVTFAILHFAYGLGFLWGLWHWRQYGIPLLTQPSTKL